MNTERGLFLPSHVPLARKLLAKEANYQPFTGPVLEAGCGDGRVAALLAQEHGIPVLGVEYDADLAAQAEDNIAHLEHRRIIPSGLVTIVQGDFALDETYKQAGVDFADIRTIVNYIDSFNPLIEASRLKSLIKSSRFKGQI